METGFDQRDMRRKGDFPLPDQVMIDIFLKLPVQKLAQLRCVCKSWNQIITSKAFVASHLKQSTSKPCFLYYPYLYLPLELGVYADPQELGLYAEKNRLNLYYGNRQTIVKLRNPPFVTQLEDWKIIGACNGVFCLCKESSPSLIYMWNPTINKYTTLPKPSYQNGIRHLGFGVNQLSGNLDDFKVVTITSNANAEVYCLNNNSWKNISDGFPSGIEISCYAQNYPVFLKGCVHWCARISCYQDSTCPWLIISFDFGNEIFQKIMLPDNLSKGDGTKVLNVANGHLCVFAAYNYYSTYELWEMMEYGVVESWTRKYIIEKPGRHYWLPLGFTSTGGIFAQGTCRHGYRTLIMYEPGSRMFNCICYLLNGVTPIQLTTFMESLVAPVAGSNGGIN